MPVSPSLVSQELPGRHFPRHRRLLLAADFSRAFRDGRRQGDRYFAVTSVARGADEGADSRLGLAISRKALPRAVDRNRIKRLIRDTFRHTDFCKAVDVVVVARAGLRDATRSSIRDSLVAHFAQLTSAAHVPPVERQRRR